MNSVWLRAFVIPIHVALLDALVGQLCKVVDIIVSGN